MLDSKVVVITGACGGLGSELVKQFLIEGSVVVALARSKPSLDKMAQQLNNKAALPKMLEKGFGRIYNLGSFADISPIENSSAYSCSKGGLHALNKSIGKDVEALARDADIEVHEWIPGHLKTQMSEFTGIEPSISAAWGVQIARGDIKAGTKCSIFENDHEWLPPKSLKHRLKDKLLFWR